jgi:hypothetical protein
LRWNSSCNGTIGWEWAIEFTVTPQAMKKDGQLPCNRNECSALGRWTTLCKSKPPPLQSRIWTTAQYVVSALHKKAPKIVVAVLRDAKLWVA